MPFVGTDGSVIDPPIEHQELPVDSSETQKVPSGDMPPFDVPSGGDFLPLFKNFYPQYSDSFAPIPVEADPCVSNEELADFLEDVDFEESTSNSTQNFFLGEDILSHITHFQAC